MRPYGKVMYWSMDTTKIGMKVDSSYQKKLRILRIKHTNKGSTEKLRLLTFMVVLIKLEEGEWMWTHGKDGTTLLSFE